MVIVNGRELPTPDADLRTFLTDAGYPLDRIAVERNAELVPRARYAETRLADGDRLEVVHFMGGG